MRSSQLHGRLQILVMRAAWRLGGGTVEQIRAELPPGQESAYTTVQTVLNRLAERGLLRRERNAQALSYFPELSESEYLARSLGESLAGASTEARRTALAQLVGALDPRERREIEALAREVARRRSRDR